VDVLYGTSQGGLYFGYDEATDAASKLEDKSILSFYRDSHVRDLAKQYKQLEEMVFATDYIKLDKLRKKVPEHNVFVEYAKAMGVNPVNEGTFDFIKSKVFRTTKPTTAGMRDQIYMFTRGVVDAVFLRRYPQGQIWQVGDTLVMTCPTNTELSSGTYMTIFSPLLGETK